MQNLRRNLPPLSSLLPFEAAARHASITKAANELGLTQAAISKQIKGLENDLGVKLFDRRNRAVYLTQEGREFSQIISEALGSISEFSSQLRRSSQEREIVLRSQLCEGLYWLMPRLSQFYQKHPEISVKVSVSQSPLSDAQESFDLALQTQGRDHSNAELIFTALDEVFPVCSPSYLKTLQEPPIIRHLAQYQLLHHQVYPQDWIDWDIWLSRLDLGMSVGTQGTSYDSYPMMIEAIAAGHGIGLGWGRTVENHLKIGTLVRPFAPSLCLQDGLSIYQPRGSALTNNAQLLLKWLQDELN